MKGLELFGLLLRIFFILFFVALAVRKRKGELPPQYDERQLLLRGRAYRSAFWVLVAYICANGMFNFIAKTVWADAMTSSFVGICLAITIFIVVCIKRDAYFPVNQQSGFYLGLLVFITLSNLATGVIRLLHERDSFFTGGALNYNVMPFVIFAMFATVLAALMIRRLRAKMKSEKSER